ncbi:Exportin-4 [Lobulomyces angularis]|nr:Exportin-4 [Lobulomyces angularis]
MEEKFIFSCANLNTPDLKLKQEAEKFLIDIRKDKNSLIICQKLLQAADQSDIVLFYVASTLKYALVFNYRNFQPNDVLYWKNFLFNFSLQQWSFRSYAVKMQFLQALCILFKRGFLIEDDTEKTLFLSKLNALCVSNNPIEKLVGINLLNALISEFSSTKASAVGLPLDFHIKVKTIFEKEALKNIFAMILNILSQGEQQLDFFKCCIELIEAILSWEFSNNAPFQKSVIKSSDNDEEKQTVSNFPANWKDIILRKETIEVIFQIYQKAAHQEELSLSSRQCLIQLSSVQGEIFSSKDSEEEKFFVKHFFLYFEDLLKLYNQNYSKFDDDDPTLVCYCEITKKVFSNFSLKIIGTISNLDSFLNQILILTLGCLNKLLNLDIDEEVSSNLFALDLLLEIWSILITKSEILEETYSGNLEKINLDLPYLKYDNFKNALIAISEKIYQHYVKFRLDLSKKMVLIELSKDIMDETNEKDHELYCDQLINVSTIGRMNPHSSLDTLIVNLNEIIATIKKLSVLTIDSNQLKNKDTEEIEVFFEYLHWLVLLTGFLIADSSVSEKAEVPRAFIISTLNENCETNAVIRITTYIFNILDIVSISNNNMKQSSFCSPLLAESLFWFFSRWASTYLFIRNTDYQSISLSFIESFSDSGGGRNVLNFLLEKTLQNLLLWHSERETTLQIFQLLLTLANNVYIRAAVLENSNFNLIVDFCLKSFHTLPESTHKLVIKAVTILVSEDSTISQNYFQLLTNAVENKLNVIIQRPDFLKIFQHPSFIGQILSSIEVVYEVTLLLVNQLFKMFGGLVLAIDYNNVLKIYSVIFAQLQSNFLNLLKLYHDFPQISAAILEVYLNVTKFITLDDLNMELRPSFLINFFNLFKTFDEMHNGNTVLTFIEIEEFHNDLNTLILMLINLILNNSRYLVENDVTKEELLGLIIFSTKVILKLLKKLGFFNFQEKNSNSNMSTLKNFLNLISNLIKYFQQKIQQIFLMQKESDDVEFFKEIFEIFNLIFVNIENLEIIYGEIYVKETFFLIFEGWDSLGEFCWFEINSKG